MRAVATFLLGVVLAATACAQAPRAGAAEDLRVELLAETFIPPEHPGLGRIGGLSGLAFIEVALGNDRFIAVSDGSEVRLAIALEPSLRAVDDPARSDLVATSFALGVEVNEVIHSMPRFEERDCEAIAVDVPFEPSGMSIPRRRFLAFERPPAVRTRSIEGAAPITFRIPSDSIRPNRGFESLCFLPHVGERGVLWAATESALVQDGPEATTESGTLCRVYEIDAQSGELRRQLMYRTDPKPRGLDHRLSLHTLVEMTSLPDGRVLALERSFDLPQGYDARLFVLDGATHGEEGARYPVLDKEHVLNFRDLGLPALGNLEGMAVGPEISELLDDPAEEGRLLLVVADDNFGRDHQKRGSQVLALRLVLGGG